MTTIEPIATLRIFQAVVAQALLDATSECRPPKPALRKAPTNEGKHSAAERSRKIREAKARTALVNRDDSREWLTSNPKSFRTICDLAGYNPDDILERAAHLAERGWPRPDTLDARFAA